jgi:hypothetical protein
VNTVESLPLIGEEVRRETRWTLPPRNWITPPDGKRSQPFLNNDKTPFSRDFPAGSREAPESVAEG